MSQSTEMCVCGHSKTRHDRLFCWGDPRLKGTCHNFCKRFNPVKKEPIQPPTCDECGELATLIVRVRYIKNEGRPNASIKDMWWCKSCFDGESYG